MQVMCRLMRVRGSRRLRRQRFSRHIPLGMCLSAEIRPPLFPHPVGMRLSVLKEASLRDAINCLRLFSTKNSIPDGMPHRKEMRKMCYV